MSSFTVLEDYAPQDRLGQLTCAYYKSFLYYYTCINEKSDHRDLEISDWTLPGVTRI